MRARGALWGLALAVCASGAAAHDDYSYYEEEQFVLCVDRLIKTGSAMTAEFPKMGKDLLDCSALRKARDDPGEALWSEFVNTGMVASEVVLEVCEAADFMERLLGAMRRDDKAAACLLVEGYDGHFSFGTLSMVRLALAVCR